MTCKGGFSTDIALIHAKVRVPMARDGRDCGLTLNELNVPRRPPNSRFARFLSSALPRTRFRLRDDR